MSVGIQSWANVWSVLLWLIQIIHESQSIPEDWKLNKLVSTFSTTWASHALDRSEKEVKDSLIITYINFKKCLHDSAYKRERASNYAYEGK